jgi:hypothetical protein
MSKPKPKKLETAIVIAAAITFTVIVGWIAYEIKLSEPTIQAYRPKFVAPPNSSLNR